MGSLIKWHPAGRVAEKSARASVKLIFADNSTVSLKNVLVENNYEDLEKFFAIIQQDHAHVQILS